MSVLPPDGGSTAEHVEFVMGTAPQSAGYPTAMTKKKKWQNPNPLRIV